MKSEMELLRKNFSVAGSSSIPEDILGNDALAKATRRPDEQAEEEDEDKARIGCGLRVAAVRDGLEAITEGGAASFAAWDGDKGREEKGAYCKEREAEAIGFCFPGRGREEGGEGGGQGQARR